MEWINIHEVAKNVINKLIRLRIVGVPIRQIDGHGSSNLKAEFLLPIRYRVRRSFY